MRHVFIFQGGTRDGLRSATDSADPFERIEAAQFLSATQGGRTGLTIAPASNESNPYRVPETRRLRALIESGATPAEVAKLAAGLRAKRQSRYRIAERIEQGDTVVVRCLARDRPASVDVESTAIEATPPPALADQQDGPALAADATEVGQVVEPATEAPNVAKQTGRAARGKRNRANRARRLIKAERQAAKAMQRLQRALRKAGALCRWCNRAEALPGGVLCKACAKAASGSAAA